MYSSSLKVYKKFGFSKQSKAPIISDQKSKRFLKVGSELLQNTIESKKQLKQAGTSHASSPAEMSSDLFKRTAPQAKTGRKPLAPVQETCQRKTSMTQKTSQMTFDHKISSQINQVLSERFPRPKSTSTSSNSSAFSSSKRRRQSQLTKSSNSISLPYKQLSITSSSEPLTTKSNSSQNLFFSLAIIKDLDFLCDLSDKATNERDQFKSSYEREKFENEKLRNELEALKLANSQTTQLTAEHQMEVLRSTLEALLIIDNFKESIAFEEVTLIKERSLNNPSRHEDDLFLPYQQSSSSSSCATLCSSNMEFELSKTCLNKENMDVIIT
ncbi:hypothetical protein G6F46_001115 [Rhizopus delemar]|uniref:Uncharacterized protein n=2 Tax=Rhizopus TaxID=4842 RepID=A0A9P6ZAL8_9FUNG|nr:hypothetical protein G6F55_001810 [Rhizopus delemar]KAG1549638.1 hypothetical protein G6F51_002932 [Rhizopus arrhizus]KAG1502477.1 hypothetical protein G6F54_002328 [Rhizopus delemar]KAG1516088.1 hypothetical protein G6F53_002420 [Rhizopus delemar]KAG1562934.1 hypothetical protein G6F49_000478 [Rhizopus delemar]